MRWRYLLVPALLLAATFHIWSVHSWGWKRVEGSKSARDFASYYYAVEVANAGADPYAKRNLDRAAVADSTRRSVHPYFYPPPFLLAMSWSSALSLQGAYRLWFFLNLASCWLAAFALWRWWRPLGRGVGVVLFLLVCGLTAVPDNLMMGQANLPVLAFIVLGAWQADSGRLTGRRRQQVLGGLLLGIACMLKMSPGLLVAWWLLRRQWVAAFSAVGAAAVLTIITSLLYGLDLQTTFYFEVLPGLASGDYNGLRVSPGLWANHSIPNLWHELLSPDPRVLSPSAQLAARVTNGLSVLALAVLFAREPGDVLRWRAQFCTVLALLIVFPVYTYEHHLVLAIPVATLAVWLVVSRRLHWSWWLPIGLSVIAWSYEIRGLHAVARDLPYLFAVILRESKFIAVLMFGLACLLTGQTLWRR